MKLSILITNPNGKDSSLCLCSVKAALAEMEAEIQTVGTKEGQTLAETIGQAICRSTGEYVLLLEPEAIIGEESIRLLCFFMDEHPDAGAIGLKMLNKHGVCLPGRQEESRSLWVSLRKMFGGNSGKQKVSVFDTFDFSYLTKEEEQRVDILAGGCMMFRREVFEKIDFQEIISEDEDAGWLCKGLPEGYKSYYLPERVIYYSWGASYTSKAKKQKHRRMLIICRKEDYKKIKNVCREQIPELERVGLWNMNEERVIDAISRRNQMEGFTDYVFCWPDTRFEQMSLLMDRMVNKQITYHIYDKESKHLVSPGK